MNLIHFSAEHLRLNAPLPFGLRDAGGRLLLAAGAAVCSADKLDSLRDEELYCDEEESNEWRRKLGAAVGVMLRQNAPLKSIAEARPDTRRAAASETRANLPDEWDSLCVLLDRALHEAKPEPGFLARIRLVHERATHLADGHEDASLYHLVHGAGQRVQMYSSHHALLVMLVGVQAARLLEWPEAAVRSLGLAALTMNAAMTELQDHLAASDRPLTAAMHEQIRQHASKGVELLRAAGADDALWLEAVRLHHDRGDGQMALRELPEAQRLARLLRRVDIFTAKISCRRTRAAMSPVLAAREACLGSDGVPDEVGAALLRATGMYPPGSCVELANGERGIVVARGRRANLPWVASLVAPSGLPLGEPVLRDTVDARYAVRAALPRQQLKVWPDHQRILALR